jgi:hypothetical protein
MKDTSRADDWRSLCEQASTEQDPQKLLELIVKINKALEPCSQRTGGDGTAGNDSVLRLLSGKSAHSLDSYQFPGERATASYQC